MNHCVGLFRHEGGVYSADALDLGLTSMTIPQTLGITHRSGVVSRFTFHHHGYSDEGDIVQANYVVLGERGFVTNTRLEVYI